MAAVGSVANIRKKLMSRLSAGDDRRNSPVKPRMTDASKSTDAAGGSTTKKKKDWPLHHQTKNHCSQQSSAVGPQQSSTTSDHYQNNGEVVDCLDNLLPPSSEGDTSWRQTSAPVDLVASCSAHARNHSPASVSAFTHDVITSSPQRRKHGLCSAITTYSLLSSFMLVDFLF